MCMKSNRCILYFHSIHSSKTVYNTSKTTILPNHLNAHSTTTVVKHISIKKIQPSPTQPTHHPLTNYCSKTKTKIYKNLSTRTSKGVSRRRTNLARSGLTSWFEMSQGA